MNGSLDLPKVTLIIAARNEERHIVDAVGSALRQDYPADRLEVIVADGQSTDATVERLRRMDGISSVRLIENPKRTMPYGLNLGIARATGDYIGVLSGHGLTPRDYVARCVEAMERTGAWAVGGRIMRRAETPTQCAISIVTSHPLGVGDSRHNYATTAGWVETAFPGFWPRSVFDRVGLFDPAMTVNEDNELSFRIRKAGGRIWYEPTIEIAYSPRSSLQTVFHQYRRYAMGKVRVFRKHRGGIGWRHILPAMWAAFLGLGVVTAIVVPAFAQVWAFVVAAYLVVIAVISIRLARPGVAWWRIAAAFLTVHLAYGLGTWHGIAGWVFGERRHADP